MEIQKENFLQQEKESEYFIPKARQSRKVGNSVVSAIMTERFCESFKVDTKQKWYQTYTVPDKNIGLNASDTIFFTYSLFI